jgi:hypothetical protein
MSSENSKGEGLKQKAIHEFEHMVGTSLYMAFLFCAVATDRMLLLNDFHDSYFNYGAALINALVIAKVILIGEYAHLGKKYEDKGHCFFPLFPGAPREIRGAETWAKVPCAEPPALAWSLACTPAPSLSLAAKRHRV